MGDKVENHIAVILIPGIRGGIVLGDLMQEHRGHLFNATAPSHRHGGLINYRRRCIVYFPAV